MVVRFVAGLYVATFDRESKQPLGFQPDRVVTLGISARVHQSPEKWEDVAQQLAALPGVESTGVSIWA